ncbi:hypothetical protein GCM10022252_39260 [Streptosporangium oxazolinicum]|uniref:Uncharacterized protein n=1 Tax=Streptosporangium oxazolinicum TaxID=909287 RepID=A0ABP8AZP9_9ACTN
MSRRVAGTVAALLLALIALVYAPLPGPADHPAVAGAAITLASGVGFAPATPHPPACDLCPPGPGLAPPGSPARVAPLPARPVPATRTLYDDSSPRAPPSSDR